MKQGCEAEAALFAMSEMIDSIVKTAVILLL